MKNHMGKLVFGIGGLVMMLITYIIHNELSIAGYSIGLINIFCGFLLDYKIRTIQVNGTRK